jgi:hypothetical protein
MGKVLILGGLVLAGIGFLMLAGVPFGRLPGNLGGVERPPYIIVCPVAPLSVQGAECR